MKPRNAAVVATIAVSLLPLRASATEVSVDIRFSTNETAIIRAYYDRHRSDASDRKGRGRTLPPGIAKNLARGKPLPPGIAKSNLPADLATRLPPVREGYERVVIDGRILLVEIATRMIHDVIEDTIVK